MLRGWWDLMVGGGEYCVSFCRFLQWSYGGTLCQLIARCETSCPYRPPLIVAAVA